MAVNNSKLIRQFIEAESGQVPVLASGCAKCGNNDDGLLFVARHMSM